VPDSANVTDIKKEIMNLDTSPGGSKFYSYTIYQSDSAMKINLEKQIAATGMINITPDMYKGLVKDQISKAYPQYDVFLHTKIFADQYKIKDLRKLNWKISSEKKKTGDWNVQKAETDFAGRHWTAWFAAEIPIQDGPYKFHGLPGLIVSLEDNSKSHVFVLNAVKNLDQIPGNIWDRKEIDINAKQYSKLLKDYENDPTKGLKQMQMGAVTMIMADGNAKHTKEQEARIKERIKKNNNQIELVKN
jgi:GLPGLI family protein